MPGYSLVPVDYQPDFGDYSLVPVDYDPFSGDDASQPATIQPESQPQPLANGANEPDIGGPANNAQAAASSESYDLVPVDYQPDFEGVSLIPVDYDPFSDDGITQQAAAQPESRPQPPAPDLHAQYQALRPMLGDRAAMLATVHPEMGQTLIAQALANQQQSGNTGSMVSASYDQPIVSDASPDPIRPGAQYAQARIGRNGGPPQGDDHEIRPLQILPANPIGQALIRALVDQAQPKPNASPPNLAPAGADRDAVLSAILRENGIAPDQVPEILPNNRSGRNVSGSEILKYKRPDETDFEIRHDYAGHDYQMIQPRIEGRIST